MREARDTAGWKEKPLSAPGRSDGGMPNGRGISGVEANRNRSSSDSWRRLVLALKNRHIDVTHSLVINVTEYESRYY